MPEDPYRYFRVEARELVDGLVKGVLDLDRDGVATPAVAELLRLAHTLKGAARVVKQPEIAEGAHAVEAALDPYRDTTSAMTSDLLRDLLARLDAISGLVAALEVPSEPAPAEQLAGEPPRSARSVRADVYEVDTLLDAIGEAHRHLDAIEQGSAGVERARVLVDLLVLQLAAVGTRDPAPIDGVASRLRSAAEELRTIVSSLGPLLETRVGQLDVEMRQARDTAERLRLVPVDVLFTDLERAARDVADEQGKSVVFDARAADIRLDADLLAHTQAALHQIVRNAVAHGIEAPAERRAAGKPAAGRVHVEVTRRGQHAVFRCRDDGRGIDLDAVRRAAEHKGLLPAGTEDVPAEALVGLLLEGGLSTSATVTEIAGRGIGLDVAREGAARVGGRVAVTTDPGGGTTVELSAPLAVSSLDALAVESSDTTVAIPLDAVRRTTRLATGDISVAGGQASVLHEGAAVPFMPLDAALRPSAATARHPRAWSTVVIEDDGKLAAFGVRRIVGSSNIVVRAVPELAAAEEVVAGVWMASDGSPRLVLDPRALVEAAARRQPPVRSDGDGEELPILVVDDSLTTRMLEQSILESAGYRVDVASSGEEGLAKATESRYGVILVDIEMPGMDGFTFVERVRASEPLRDTPCILVSSRASPADRQRGADAGAVAYIAKSEFDQGELLERIHAVAVR